MKEAKYAILLLVIGALCGFWLFSKTQSTWAFQSSKKQYAQNGEKIDLNTASPKELRRLPGIGPVFADRIVQNRPYRSIDDVLHKIPGFGRERWIGIRDYVMPFPAVKKAAPAEPVRWPPVIYIENRTSKSLRFLFLNPPDGQLIVEVPLAPWDKIKHPHLDSTARIAVMNRNTKLCSGDYNKESWNYTIYEFDGKIRLLGD